MNHSMNTNVNIEQLDNGITIATDQMDSIETVSVSVLVKVGSRNENEANNGISHFLEHMAFKGTKRRTALQIAEEFDMIGGYFNAYTSREKTVFYAKVLKDDLTTAVDILADILQHSTFAEDEIEKEREVILQEIHQTNDTPDDLIFDLFYETAYSDQPFGRGILGKPSYIQKVTSDDVRQFVGDNYCSSNIIVSAAGNIRGHDFRQMVIDNFDCFAAHSSVVPEKSRYTGGDLRVDKDLEQVHLILGFEGVHYTHDDFYTQQVLSIILGGGMSSRLFQEVREKRGLAYSISSFGSSYKDTGLFGIYSATSEDKTNELVKIIGEEIQKITDTISDEEMARAKAQVRASLLMSQESSVSRSEKLAGNIAAIGRYVTINEILDKINKLDSHNLQNFACKLFAKNSLPTIASIGKIANLSNYNELVKQITL